MATDSASAIESGSTPTNGAYVSPTVDFLIVLIGMSALALVGAAVILP